MACGDCSAVSDSDHVSRKITIKSTSIAIYILCSTKMSPNSPMPPLAPPQPANVRNSNMAHLNPLPPSVFTLTQTAQLEALYTIIRDKETSRGDFLFYSDRIIRLLVEEGLNHLPVVSRTVETPTVS